MLKTFDIAASNSDREELRVALATVEDDQVDKSSYPKSEYGLHIKLLKSSSYLNVQEAGVGLASPPSSPAGVSNPYDGHFVFCH